MIRIKIYFNGKLKVEDKITFTTLASHTVLTFLIVDYLLSNK